MHRDEVAAPPLVIGLVGNPNSGKSSLFNRLTGLRQKVGNFPGVTVDKKEGVHRLPSGERARVVDFPGAYSFYPTSQDERVVVRELIDSSASVRPDLLLYVADLTKLDKHLLLFSQLRDLEVPMILVLNMSDLAESRGLRVDVDYLARKLDTPTVAVSTRTGAGLDRLDDALNDVAAHGDPYARRPAHYPLPRQENEVSAAVGEIVPARNPYHGLLLAHHAAWLPGVTEKQRHGIQEIRVGANFHSLRAQVEETMARYAVNEPIVERAVSRSPDKMTFSDRLDRVLTHRVWGPIIFIVIMLLLFQALYKWAEAPMDAIEWFFGTAGEGIRAALGAGWLTDLLVDGLIAGLGGILVFAPQIAILFFLISLLEEVGYMARAAFMFDRIMQAFGLNGRSVVALISGHACAIPAIMSTRTIANWKERLLTILVTPLTSCSARIPVYTVLIGFAVPESDVLGGWSVQGLAFSGLYLLGIAAAMGSALLFKLVLRSPDRSFLMLELPDYRWPVWRNVFLTVYEKVRTFAVEAGKVIIIISIILWGLSTYGPQADMDAATAEATQLAATRNLGETAAADLLASRRLEASYAGQIGHFIEPAIRPLGYDWKIGIALLTSFAAREVFVGTMATIYSIGSVEDEFSVRDRLAREMDPVTGEPVYNRAVAWSLLIFYVFAMMCISTLAITYRETRSWKWPALQFFFMTGLAYVSAFVVYQVLS